MNIYKENYKVLKSFISVSLSPSKRYEVIEKNGYLPLLIERIAQNNDYEIILLASLYNNNGDLLHDPSLEIKVSYKECTAEVISFQQDRFKTYKRASDDQKTNFELNMFLKISILHILV